MTLLRQRILPATMARWLPSTSLAAWRDALAACLERYCPRPIALLAVAYCGPDPADGAAVRAAASAPYPWLATFMRRAHTHDGLPVFDPLSMARIHVRSSRSPLTNIMEHAVVVDTGTEYRAATCAELPGCLEVTGATSKGCAALLSELTAAFKADPTGAALAWIMP